MIYVILNEDGTIKTSHNDDTVIKLPAGAVEITEDQWMDRLKFRRVNGAWVEIPKQEKEEETDNG